MYKCCIFDLDGTLVNSIYALQRSVNETLKIWGFREITLEETRQFVGDGYKKLLERSLLACGDETLSCYEEAVKRYEGIFKECCLYRVEAYEGIRELLQFLKEQGICTAVLSNKPHARTLDNVNGVFGEALFDRVYGEEREPGDPEKAMSGRCVGYRGGAGIFKGRTALSGRYQYRYGDRSQCRG